MFDILRNVGYNKIVINFCEVKKMKKRLILIMALLILSIFVISGCGTKKYTYKYFEITNVEEYEENYSFSYTVKNTSNEDILVCPRVFLITGGTIEGQAKQLAKGESYTFYCKTNSGKIHANPQGMIAVYDANGNGLEVVSFKFDI